MSSSLRHCSTVLCDAILTLSEEGSERKSLLPEGYTAKEARWALKFNPLDKKAMACSLWLPSSKIFLRAGCGGYGVVIPALGAGQADYHWSGVRRTAWPMW